MANRAADPSTKHPTQLQSAMARGRGVLIAVGIFSCVINLLMLASPIYMMQVFDRVLASGSHETLLYLTLIVGIAFAVLGALEMVRGRLFARLGGWLENRLGPDMLAASITRRLRGTAMAGQALRDLGQIRSFFGGQGIQPLFDAPWVPIFLICIWFLHPWLGLLATGAALLLLGLALLNEFMARGPQQRSARTSLGAQTNAEAAIRNADVVHAMGLLPAMAERWRRDNSTALDEQLVGSDRGSAVVGSSKFLRLFVQSAILGLGAYLVLQGSMTAGGMIAGSILLGRALAPVEQAIGAWRQVVAARISYDRLNRLLRATPSAGDPQPLPAFSGRVAFERVTALPPGANRGEAKPILKGVTFDLQPGRALAVVGPSASGKTTLCRLLAGAWAPVDGTVRLDGADVGLWDRAQLGPQIGYLPQDVELFAGTVRENIARFRDAADTEVFGAAQLAGVHEMILRLPKGYDTEIGENGTALSAGQRQRIGLARALFGNPRLLVLDEPNANLDQDGEAALVRAISAAKEGGATVVLVTHRPSVLSQVDMIVVLRDGVVDSIGPRDEILSKLRGPRPVPATAAPAKAGAQ